MRMRWAGHVAPLMTNAYRILVEKPEGRDLSKDKGTDGKVILERILGK
jgi:hypothetical protein